MKLFFILLLSFYCFTAMAQNKAKQLDSLFAKMEKEKNFNGNVLVAEKDKIIFQRSIGKADLAGNKDLDAGSLFELASVSKQFTAMGIMLLKKQGRLSYDDSLRQFFPELPYHNITIRHLLNHTSGLPDYMRLFVNNWDSKKIATNTDMLALLAQHKPAALFAPGDKWEYSNTGYAILASIIEKVSGKQFGDYLKENIFVPLGMNRSLVYRRRYEMKKIPNYAFGYVYDDREMKFVLPDSLPVTASIVYSLDGIVGDGTVNSTTGDMFLWSRALTEGKLVGREMIAEAFTPGTLNDGKKHNYGFGWIISSDKKTGTIASHSGSWPGYITYIEKSIDSDKTIIILANYEQGALPAIKIGNILYGIKEEKKEEIKLPEELLRQYEGEYELAPGFIITISVENGKIYERATGQARLEIFPEKQDVFFLKEVEAQLKFIRNEQKLVKSLILLQGGQEIEGPKIK